MTTTAHCIQTVVSTSREDRQARRRAGIRHYVPGYYLIAVAALVLSDLVSEQTAGWLAVLLFVVVPLLGRATYRQQHEAAVAPAATPAIQQLSVFDATPVEVAQPSGAQVPLQ